MAGMLSRPQQRKIVVTWREQIRLSDGRHADRHSTESAAWATVG
jgi:hypothetical protein